MHNGVFRTSDLAGDIKVDLLLTAYESVAEPSPSEEVLDDINFPAHAGMDIAGKNKRGN